MVLGYSSPLLPLPPPCSLHLLSSTSSLSHSPQGMKRFHARKVVLEALKEKGLYKETKENQMVVPICRYVCACVATYTTRLCCCDPQTPSHNAPPSPPSLVILLQPLQRHCGASDQATVVCQLWRDGQGGHQGELYLQIQAE